MPDGFLSETQVVSTMMSKLQQLLGFDPGLMVPPAEDSFTTLGSV